MKEKINIIGAGIAGLSAGCYLQMNGYDTQIFELHNLPGGLCTDWERKGYIFNGCIHWLVGSSPDSNFYHLWNELVNMKNLEFVNHDEFIRVEDRSGKYIRVFTNIDKLEKEFLEKAPEDENIILEFTKAVRKFLKFEPSVDKPPQLATFWDNTKLIFKMMPVMGDFRKWLQFDMDQFSQRCKNPLLRRTFNFMFMPEIAALFVVMTMVWMHKKAAGYPIGGSLKFSKLIEKRYVELGGKICYNSKVEKIITQDNQAKGIELKNGEKHLSDIVISAADGHYTIFKMLNGNYINDKIKDYYQNYEIFPSYLQISLGINRTFDDLPHAVTLALEKPLLVDEGTYADYLGVQTYNFDPTLTPKGKTVMIAMLITKNYSYWENLKKDDPAAYQADKNRIANEAINALECRFGDVKKHIEVVDVSTPATVIRYTNNWRGSFEGWLLDPKMGIRQMSKELPGLDNFYMIGQWVEPGGGLPPALLSGRNVTQIICKKDKKKFVTQKF